MPVHSHFLMLDYAIVESDVKIEIEAAPEDCSATEANFLPPNQKRTKINKIIGKLTCNILPDMKRLHTYKGKQLGKIMWITGNISG